MSNAPIHITQITPSSAQRKLPYPWPSGHFFQRPIPGLGAHTDFLFHRPGVGRRPHGDGRAGSLSLPGWLEFPRLLSHQQAPPEPTSEVAQSCAKLCQSEVLQKPVPDWHYTQALRCLWKGTTLSICRIPEQIGTGAREEVRMT